MIAASLLLTSRVAESDASQVMSVKHTAETLTASHPSESGAHALVFRMDGKPAETTFGHEDHAMTFVTRARWEGNALVLEQMPQESQEGVRVKQVWTLLPDGRLRVAVDAIEPDGESHTQTLIFKRK
jgi:hypothetical protein